MRVLVVKNGLPAIVKSIHGNKCSIEYDTDITDVLKLSDVQIFVPEIRDWCSLSYALQQGYLCVQSADMLERIPA